MENIRPLIDYVITYRLQLKSCEEALSFHSYIQFNIQDTVPQKTMQIIICRIFPSFFSNNFLLEVFSTILTIDNLPRFHCFVGVCNNEEINTCTRFRQDQSVKSSTEGAVFLCKNFRLDVNTGNLYEVVTGQAAHFHVTENKSTHLLFLGHSPKKEFCLFFPMALSLCMRSSVQNVVVVPWSRDV